LFNRCTESGTKNELYTASFAEVRFLSDGGRDKWGGLGKTKGDLGLVHSIRIQEEVGSVT